jgi:integrase
MPELASHLREFAQPGRDGLVFAGPRGGRLWRSNLQTEWDNALAKAGGRDDLNFHDLRHTGNTLAASSGASLRDLIDGRNKREGRQLGGCCWQRWGT